MSILMINIFESQFWSLWHQSPFNLWFQLYVIFYFLFGCRDLFWIYKIPSSSVKCSLQHKSLLVFEGVNLDITWKWCENKKSP